MSGSTTSLGQRSYEPDYDEIVKETDPLVYWPLGERTGAIAYDVTGNEFNGAIDGATLGEPGIGDGLTSMLFDGVDDFVNVFSPGLAAGFDGTLCSVMIWVKVFDNSVWTDDFRNFYLLQVEAGAPSNRIRGSKENVDGEYQTNYEANDVQVRRSVVTTTLDWFQSIQTIDAGADKKITYHNAVQQGVTQGGLGAWAGVLNAAATYIGRGTDAVFEFWHGWLSKCAIWDRVLARAEVERLYRARWTR